MNQPRREGESKGRRQGVVAVCFHNDRFLVVRRSQTVEAPGAYCFPGGAVEAGEDEDQTLRREMHEELGCSAVALRRLWRSTTDWGVEIAWWLTEIDPAGELRLNEAEVQSVHWLRDDEMRQMPDLLTSNLAFLNAWRNEEFSL